MRRGQVVLAREVLAGVRADQLLRGDKVKLRDPRWHVQQLQAQESDRPLRVVTNRVEHSEDRLAQDRHDVVVILDETQLSVQGDVFAERLKTFAPLSVAKPTIFGVCTSIKPRPSGLDGSQRLKRPRSRPWRARARA